MKHKLLSNITLLIRYGLYILIVLWLILIPPPVYKFVSEDLPNLINLIATVTSLTVAVIITFVFSKLFSEREDRIQRKVTIDEYSLKVNALRKIAFYLRQEPAIWEVLLPVAGHKAILEKYTLAKWKIKIHPDLHEYELGALAYLSLKEMEINEGNYGYFQLRNYTENEIVKFIECSGNVWRAFLNHNGEFTINKGSIWIRRINTEYQIAAGVIVSDSISIASILDLFSVDQNSLMNKLRHLIVLNNKPLSRYFYWMFFNFIIYSIILILSLALFIAPFCNSFKLSLLVFLIQLFILNTIDLIFGLIFTIKKEVKVTEIYKI